MKAGDNVVCIAVNPIDIYTGRAYPHPRIDEVVKVVLVDCGGYLYFRGWDIESGFETCNFRKVQPAKTNTVTRELVREFKEVEERIEKPQKVES